MKTVQSFHDLVDQMVSRIKKATGNDPFLSQADLEKMLNPMDLPDKLMYQEFVGFVRSFEKKQKGRITERNLDQVATFLHQKLINHLSVQPGPLSEETKASFQSLGEPSTTFADSLKLYLETPRNLSSDELFQEIRSLGESLSLGTYASGGQSTIETIHVEANLKNLDSESFLSTLEKTPDQTYATIRDYKVERIVPGATFLEDLIAFQGTPALQQQAKALKQIMVNHFKDLQLIVLVRDERSFIPLFLVGVTQTGNLGGFLAFVLWA